MEKFINIAGSVFVDNVSLFPDFFLVVFDVEVNVEDV